jgi:hypothetical protein
VRFGTYVKVDGNSVQSRWEQWKIILKFFCKTADKGSDFGISPEFFSL